MNLGELLPQDEYECAADPIGGLLRRVESTDRIAAALSECRAAHFGCEPDPALDGRIAEEIATWYSAAIAATLSGDVPDAEQ